MKWVMRWGYLMSPTPIRPGIYRLKDGGFFLRARVADVTGELKLHTEVAHHLKTPAEAQRRRDEIVAEAREAARGVIRSRQLWSEFAVSLLEERVAKGSIESAATVEIPS